MFRWSSHGARTNASVSHQQQPKVQVVQQSVPEHIDWNSAGQS
jgi:hypothetical protein